MKRVTTFRLSEQALAVLDKQANKSQFIEELILNGSPEADSKSPITKEDLADFIKTFKTPSAPATEFVPQPPGPNGYLCCEKSSPCKHWVWYEFDTVWKNTITGKERDE
jgi:hypothetical protein